MALRLSVHGASRAPTRANVDRGELPRTEEDRRLAGVPACRNRVAEIGSRNRGSEKLEGGPLRKGRTSFFERAGARPRGDHLGPGVERRLGPSASSDRANHSADRPTQLVGHGIADVLDSCQDALPKEGISGCSIIGTLHGVTRIAA
jgi:hypothetical protein